MVREKCEDKLCGETDVTLISKRLRSSAIKGFEQECITHQSLLTQSAESISMTIMRMFLALCALGFVAGVVEGNLGKCVLMGNDEMSAANQY